MEKEPDGAVDEIDETADNSDVDCAAEESLPNELPSDLEELKKLPQIKVKKGFRWVNSGCSEEGMGQVAVKKGLRWVRYPSQGQGAAKEEFIWVRYPSQGQHAVNKGFRQITYQDLGE